MECVVKSYVVSIAITSLGKLVRNTSYDGQQNERRWNSREHDYSHDKFLENKSYKNRHKMDKIILE